MSRISGSGRTKVPDVYHSSADWGWEGEPRKSSHPQLFDACESKPVLPPIKTIIGSVRLCMNARDRAWSSASNTGFNSHHLRRLLNPIRRRIMHHVPGLRHDRDGGVSSISCLRPVTYPSALRAFHVRFWGKADMTFCGANVCMWPKRTLLAQLGCRCCIS
jgi:hypothetical protein